MSAIEGYTSSTSVAQGENLYICISNSPEPGTTFDFDIDIIPIDSHYFSGNASSVFKGKGHAKSYAYPPMAFAQGCGWPIGFELSIGENWESGLYLAVLTNGNGAQTYINFIVKSAKPGTAAAMLLCWPVTTCQAYNSNAGKSLYPTESCERYPRVSFDRPTDWGNAHALPFWRWIVEQGYSFDACTSIDLHEAPDFLAEYQLLVSIGHDEYWSKEMRDNVENFVANGGNVAFFSGNTCWWQVRLEDDYRTIVCHKSALDDPLTGIDNERVTTNWASAPVNRPENLLTGVSYRTGAQSSDPPPVVGYQVLAADHWVFAGTDLNNGDSFAAGALGYETDAAELTTANGATCPTGRDGTPENFVALANADLRSWRDDKTGGWATMGLYTNGGAVFTAGTIEWANALADEVTAQVTRNVIERLSEPYSGDPWQLRTNRVPSDQWEIIGTANEIVTMTSMIEGYLFAVNQAGDLLWRAANGENLPWERIGTAQGVVALTAPLVGGVQLLAATEDNQILGRPPVGDDLPWQVEYDAPADTIGLAAPNVFYAVTADGVLLWRTETEWTEIGSADGIIALAWWDSKLFALTDEGRILAREAVTVDVAWEDIGEAPEASVALGAYYGALFLVTGDGTLWWKAAVCDPAPLATGQLLFYNTSTGSVATGLFDSKGYFFPNAAYPDPSAGNDAFSRDWTHIADGGQGRLLFYDSATGKGAAGQLDTDGTFKTLQMYPDPSVDVPSFSAHWSHVVGMGDGRILFYDTNTGKGAVGFLQDDGEFETWQQFPDPAVDNPSFSSGWTHIVSAGNMVLFYGGGSGRGAVGQIDEDGSFATLQFYPDPDSGHDSFAKGWTHIVSCLDSLLFFYSMNTGNAATAVMNGDGELSTLQHFPDPDTKLSSFPNGWTHVVAGRNGLLLFYNSANGQVTSGGLDLEGRFTALQNYAAGAFSNYWSQIVAAKP